MLYAAPNVPEPFLLKTKFKTRTLLPIAMVALLSLTLAGCGRRGPLEPPPNTPQGQALAKQRANSNAKRGLGPNGGPADSPEEKAAKAKLDAINDESDARNDDALSQRDRDLLANPDGEPQMAFPTGTDMVKPPPMDDAPKTKATASNDSGGVLKGSGRKAPPIQRPDKPFILDGLLN